jgi:DNA-binding response OmpR family regulator
MAPSATPPQHCQFKEHDVRILVADMDEELLELLQSFLWDRGHEAEIAADGLEFLITLRVFQPDVLVLDQKLLWGDSDELVTVLGEDPTLSGIPVVLITGEATADEFDATVMPSMIGWLPKPFRLCDLLACLELAGTCRVPAPADTARLVVTLDSSDLEIAYAAVDSLPRFPCYAGRGEG